MIAMPVALFKRYQLHNDNVKMKTSWLVKTHRPVAGFRERLTLPCMTGRQDRDNNVGTISYHDLASET